MPDSGQLAPVTGVILAGGQGRRLGGQDKGLFAVEDRPLIEHVIAALEPQVSDLMINANRNIETYEHYGYKVLSDELPDYQGPLSGMLAGLRQASNERIMFVPCDTVSLPADLVRRMSDTMDAKSVDLCVAHDGNRMQPVYALLSKSCIPALEKFLDSGQRKAEIWMTNQGAALVDFSDIPDAFSNINSPDDIKSTE